ncbi:hypothetical protein KI387_005506, partial [Taxus chinensis]
YEVQIKKMLETKLKKRSKGLFETTLAEKYGEIKAKWQKRGKEVFKHVSCAGIDLALPFHDNSISCNPFTKSGLEENRIHVQDDLMVEGDLYCIVAHALRIKTRYPSSGLNSFVADVTIQIGQMEEVEYGCGDLASIVADGHGDLASVVAHGTHLNRSATNEEQIQLKEDDTYLNRAATNEEKIQLKEDDIMLEGANLNSDLVPLLSSSILLSYLNSLLPHTIDSNEVARIQIPSPPQSMADDPDTWFSEFLEIELEDDLFSTLSPESTTVEDDPNAWYSEFSSSSSPIAITKIELDD